MLRPNFKGGNRQPKIIIPHLIKRKMKYLISILFLVGLFSCKENNADIERMESENLTTEQIDSILTEFKFQYESAIVLESTDQVLIPISTELLERRNRLSKDGYYSNEYPRYWNVLFYNMKTGESRLLTEDKIRISRIHAVTEEKDEGNKLMHNKILYEIGDIDFNKDKKLNDGDPEHLFSSEINGMGLKRVSPINEDLQYFKVISKSDQILLRTLRDINQDSIFSPEDESIWYKADLRNQEWKITEIIDSTGRKRIEKLYFKQWLTKK